MFCTCTLKACSKEDTNMYVIFHQSMMKYDHEMDSVHLRLDIGPPLINDTLIICNLSWV